MADAGYQRSGIGWNAKLGWKLDRGSRYKNRKRQPFKCSLSSLNLSGSRRRLNANYWRTLFRDWADRINNYFTTNVTHRSAAERMGDERTGRYKKNHESQQAQTCPAPPKPPRLSVTTATSLPALSSTWPVLQNAEENRLETTSLVEIRTLDGVSCATVESALVLVHPESSGAAGEAVAVAAGERQEAEGREEGDNEDNNATEQEDEEEDDSQTGVSTGGGNDKSRLFFTKLLQEMRQQVGLNDHELALSLPPLPPPTPMTRTSSTTTGSFRTPSPSPWPEEDFSLDEFQLEDARILWRRWRLEEDEDVVQLSEVLFVISTLRQYSN